MNKINEIIKRVLNTLDKVIVSKLFIATAIGLAIGWALSIIKLDSIFLVITSIVIITDLVFTYLKNKELLLDKTLAVILLIVIARGIPAIESNYAAVFGVLYYRFESIILTIKSLLQKTND